MPLPILTGRQSDVVYLDSRGHHVVLGTAGTGKTVMAVLRANYLSSPSTPGGGPVLLVTYNNALVRYLEYLRGGYDGDVVVRTYARFARGYLNSRGLMPRYGAIASPYQKRDLVEQATLNVAEQYQKNPFFDRDPDFFVDEVSWLDGMGIASLQEYQSTERFGRGTGLDDSRREVVWRIRSEYKRLREESSFRYDWDDIAVAAHEALEHDSTARMFRHVVIDEGQDLSPEAIRSLVRAADPAGSVTFFGDYAQQIYGQGLSWRSCNLAVRKVERFADNYRNSPEIARLAIAISAMPTFGGHKEDLVEPVEPTAAGTPPTLAVCKNETQEISIVRSQAAAFGRVGKVAVLARTWADARRACRGLPVTELNTDKMGRWNEDPGIYCGAYHSAKGFEFDAVILPFCSTARVPSPETVSALGEEEAAVRESKLLYVAVTRAKSDLIISYTDALTPLLPSNEALYRKVEA